MAERGVAIRDWAKKIIKRRYLRNNVALSHAVEAEVPASRIAAVIDWAIRA